MTCFIVTIFLWGCNKPLVKEHEFIDQTWRKFDTVEFKIPSTSKNKPYHIKLCIKYFDSFPTSDLPLMVTMQSPSGEERFFTKRIWLKSLDGKPKGVQADGHYALEEIVWYEYEFKEKGEYRLIIESDHPNYQIEGIISMSIEVIPGAIAPPKPEPGNFKRL